MEAAGTFGCPHITGKEEAVGDKTVKRSEKLAFVLPRNQSENTSTDKQHWKTTSTTIIWLHGRRILG